MDETHRDRKSSEVTGLNVDKVLTQGVQVDRVDLSGYSDLDGPTHTSGSPIMHDPLAQMSWRGHWKLWDHYSLGVGYIDVSIPSSDGPFRGQGYDYSGKFTISGQRSGRRITLNRSYCPGTHIENPPSTWRLHGIINESEDTIEGIYSYVTDDKGEDDFDEWETIATAKDTAFVIRRRPLSYWLFSPSEVELRKNKSRALWTFAINAILHAVRKNIRPYLVLDRRRLRRQYIELFLQLKARPSQWSSPEVLEKLNDIERRLSPADILFFSSVANSIWRREIIYS